MNKDCHCPNVVCPVHGDCEACVSKNLRENTLANCMEKRAAELGAQLQTHMPRTIVEKDHEAMSERCAERIAQQLFAKPEALFCFAAGDTNVRTYEILAKWAAEDRVDFSKARFVALDDWLDLTDERDNCNAFIHRHFYDPLNIRPEQKTLFNLHADDLAAECRRVDQVIFEHGGLDFMLLGMGMNGHLGLNEPGGSFEDYAKVVALSPVTARVGKKYFRGDVELTRGITLGVRHMFEAKQVVLQVSGKHKAEILARIYASAPTQALPATVMKLLPHGLVVADQDAVSLIPALRAQGTAQ